MKITFHQIMLLPNGFQMRAHANVHAVSAAMRRLQSNSLNFFLRLHRARLR